MLVLVCYRCECVTLIKFVQIVVCALKGVCVGASDIVVECRFQDIERGLHEE